MWNWAKPMWPWQQAACKQLQAALKTQPHTMWTELGITDLSNEVLGGFGRYALSLPTYPLDFDHLKIQATGRLCRYLHRQKSVRYVSISMQKATSR